MIQLNFVLLRNHILGPSVIYIYIRINVDILRAQESYQVGKAKGPYEGPIPPTLISLPRCLPISWS